VTTAPASATATTATAVATRSALPPVFIVGVPVVWALALLVHPTGDGEDFYPIVRDEVGPWLFVHVATLVFVPLLALTLYALVHGVCSSAATVARVSLGVFVVAYCAWEATIGIGTGILVDRVGDTDGAEEATGAALIESFTDSGMLRVLEYTGSLAWGVAAVAAAVALRRGVGLPRYAVAALIVSAPLVVAHVPPIGPVGLALYLVSAVAVLARRGAGAELH
jgi:hypothetical protein